jgi:RNA polymerase sigma-70 factor (ECF subfamily)
LDVEALFETEGAFIGRTIERLVGAGPHVDDLLQETFIVAFRKQAAFRPERGAPRAWLYGIAANLSRRWLRSQRRFGLFRRRLEERDESSGPRPDEEIERSEERKMVHEILQSLSLEHREIFVLYELEGLAGPDIAAMVGVPIGTVWSRLHHARREFTERAKRRAMREERA